MENSEQIGGRLGARVIKIFVTIEKEIVLQNRIRWAQQKPKWWRAITLYNQIWVERQRYYWMLWTWFIGDRHRLILKIKAKDANLLSKNSL